MLFDAACLIYDVGSTGADLLVGELCGHIATGLSSVVVDAASEALPSIGFGMLSSLHKMATPDLLSSVLGINQIRDAVMKEVTGMGVSVVAANELEALRAVANAAAGQGDLKAALAALVAVKAAGPKPSASMRY